MYSFCDTTDAPQINPLPSEAVCFNDKWLDMEVPGFRTLSVEGREFVQRSIDTYSVGYSDGVFYRGSSFSGRTITVFFQIVAKDQYEYREAFNVLNSVLRTTQAQLIFADEPDKYFVATRASFGSVPTGRNAVTGSISFYCADPRKYAIKEKEVAVTVASGTASLEIRNDGNVDVPISYEISCTSDNGYVGIENGEDYIRFGNEEEVDGEDSKTAQRLLTFNSIKNATDDAATGITNGAMNTVTLNGKTWLGNLSNVGSGTEWHGAKRTVTIQADSNGDVGAKNFKFYAMHWFQVANVNMKGRQTIKFLDASDNEVLSFQISKTNASNTAATVRFYVNTEIKKTIDFQCGSDEKTNPFFNNRGHNSIEKAGGKVKFYFFGKYYTFEDDAIKNTVIKKVQFCVYAYGTSTPVTRNYIGDFVLQKNDVDTWNNVKNRYSAGDVVEVNGEEGKLYVNGQARLGDEKKGSEYFHADPGDNSVTVNCSEWATGISVKARIREAWI